MTTIRQAQRAVIDTNAHAYVGASYDNIELENDCTHIYDNQTWGHRWAEAVQAAEILPQCDDGLDNDADGFTDFPADPACQTAAFTRENSQCQDGLDNDHQTGIDFDGGASLHSGVPIGDPDPQCVGNPWRNTEAANCGLGAELALVLPLLSLAA
ncbi:MAG: hypothetical protein NTZ61_00130, partial [Proteobacteria bacterium]|nr:hypothetical protein [Pseudomonadota bacterium]